MGKRSVNSETRRAVFLDRDGVINRSLIRDGKPFPPTSPNELEIFSEAAEACTLLKTAGFQLVIVTNQPDVGRGTLALERVEEIHQKIRNLLPIDRIEVCYDGDDSSEFRKPNPGMLKRAAQALNLNLGASFIVGDRWRDVDCGHAAGCQTIFIDRGYTESLKKPPHHRASNLLEAARIILAASSRSE
jgi:D-glycero-D-manno-heptose 1,7-bisphosphate phosphatase